MTCGQCKHKFPENAPMMIPVPPRSRLVSAQQQPMQALPMVLCQCDGGPRQGMLTHINAVCDCYEPVMKVVTDGEKERDEPKLESRSCSVDAAGADDEAS